jgi:hypothetical protein
MNNEPLLYDEGNTYSVFYVPLDRLDRGNMFKCHMRLEKICTSNETSISKTPFPSLNLSASPANSPIYQPPEQIAHSQKF